jgi:pimeloyl-ACP methyl ester carboxylesterase
MQTTVDSQVFTSVPVHEATSTAGLRAGRVLSGIAVLFLVVDSIGKLLQVEPVVAGTVALGYPVTVIFALGVTLSLCVLAYVVPATSALGAVLLTGYLGGAVATHVRVGDPVLSHVLFPVYVAALLWGGLLLRDPRVRALVPWQGQQADAHAGGREQVVTEAISKDGTRIAYQRCGRGPSLIIVDGALCSRTFGPSAGLAKLLAPHFTVFRYDRRGRGASGDMPPYAKEREVEDIAALIREAGEPVFLLGLSSGGALALEAAASGLEIRKVVAYEPPYVDDSGQRGGAAHEGRLRALIAAGNRGGAVTYFVKDMVEVPAPFVVMMRLMPWVWRQLKAVAHTLPYDAAIMTDFRVPRARLRSVRTPLMAMNGSKTDRRLQESTRAVADTVPGARHLTLAGQTHNVKPAALVPAVLDFFLA